MTIWILLNLQMISDFDWPILKKMLMGYMLAGPTILTKLHNAVTMAAA